MIFSNAGIRETTTAWIEPDSTAVITEVTMHPSTVISPGSSDTEPSNEVMAPPSYETVDPSVEEGEGSSGLGLAACITAAIMALCGIFLFPQRNTIIGADGLCALWFLGSWAYGYFLYQYEGFTPFFYRCIGVFLLLLTLRLLWGWCLKRFSSEQCLLYRLSCKMPGEGMALLLILAWMLLFLALLWCYGTIYGYPHNWLTYCLGAVTVLFGLFFLLKYVVDLQHFRKQLDNYRRGMAVEVKKGTFAQTEEQLLLIRKEHEEAIRSAVVGERFKVDLIANVSHDLRTPLTSILGYSELLEKEKLSPKGQEQLKRLHEKSIYMNELVGSLFELTKVESGAVEPRKERIDIVKLLEQTVGFLDDRLQAASLEARRQYAVDSLYISSDGGLLHQVLANLLGNAIKYALTNTRIYLELKEEIDSIQIRMVNTANYEMDFSEEEIMERFARGDKARSTRGSGIGLAIAKTYTEAMGGSFCVKVDGDQFNAFVTLPKN